jgi:hypothetical protein
MTDHVEKDEPHDKKEVEELLWTLTVIRGESRAHAEYI